MSFQWIFQPEAEPNVLTTLKDGVRCGIHQCVCAGGFIVRPKWKIRKQEDWKIADVGNSPLRMLLALQQAVAVPLDGMRVAKDFSTVSGPEKE